MSPIKAMKSPSIEELNTMLHAYNFLSLLQATDFCCHYKALRRDDQIPITVHLSPRGESGDNLIDRAKRCYKLRHQNLLSVYDCGKTENFCYAISRYIDGNTLEDLIQDGPISVRQATSYISEIASALNLCQRRRIFPEHIHLDNIVMDATNHPLISMMRMPFHPDYLYTIAPELRDAQSSPNEKTTIFSLGSMLNTLITGSQRLDNDGSSILPTPIARKFPALLTLISSMTAANPDERAASIQQCLDDIQALELDNTTYKPAQKTFAKTVPLLGASPSIPSIITPTPSPAAPKSLAAHARPTVPTPIRDTSHTHRPASQQNSRQSPLASPPQNSSIMKKRSTNFFFYIIPLLLVCISFFYTYFCYQTSLADAHNKKVAVVAKPKPVPAPTVISDEDLTKPEGEGLTTIEGEMPEEAPEEAIGDNLAEDDDDAEEDYRGDELEIDPTGINNWCRIGLPLIKQSQNFRGGRTYSAYRATDGKLEDNGRVSAAVADGNKNAWWRIDFGSENLRKISQIKILGPGKVSIPGKLGAFKVTIASASGEPIAEKTFTKTPVIWDISESLEARGIRIDAASPRDILILREVEILGPAN